MFEIAHISVPAIKFKAGMVAMKEATYERGGVSIVTAVEELAAGRYRGILTIDTAAGQWRYDCPKCHSTPQEACADADADLEYAFRRYLMDPHGGRKDPGALH